MNYILIAILSILGLLLGIILDFEFPRFGLIRIDSFDQLLVDVRESMK